MMDDKQDLNGIFQFSQDERRELAMAFLARDDTRHLGKEVLRAAFPAAAAPMIDAATFHLYDEAPRAMVDLIAELEFSIRSGTRFCYAGFGWEVLYHLYNFIQLEALLPFGVGGLSEELDDLEEIVTDGDLEGAVEVIKTLRARLDACEIPPDID